MKIAVIGGGMMGLTLAYRLSQQKRQVTLFEGSQQLGGLTTHHDYGLFTWDRFYHVILPSDRYTIDLLREIGLGDRLQWHKTLTGFYVDRQYHSISNTVEFLRFPPLNLVDKIRLAFTLIYGSRVNNWQRLERIRVKDWLIRLSGRSTYQKFWKPLLAAKLGENYQRVSAVFIWAYIKRLFSARDSSLQKEQLGYVEGGYKTVFDRLASSIESNHGKIRTGVAISQIKPDDKAGIWIDQNGRLEHFDKVIFTGPVNILERIADKDLVDIERSRDLVEYLGVICMVLITRTPLVPYYVVNIADPQVPFTGVIGMSNLVSLAETAGLHMTYLPKYILSDDPLLQQSDADIERLFFAGLDAMFPTLDRDDIVSVHINRATKVQPLQVLNYSQLVPKTTPSNHDFFILNTSQLVDNNPNNNAVVKHVNGFVDRHFSERNI